MEINRNSKRNVALVEKCVMSSVGIKSLFDTFPGYPYRLYTYSTQDAFRMAMMTTSFSAVIFSLSAIRKERRVGLSCLNELANKNPRMRRLVIADDDMEARLINSLSPSPLDGVLSKASTLLVLQEDLYNSLTCIRQKKDSAGNPWYLDMLSPTEREILHYMSRGYSMMQIAAQLKRNIKTIRAHKFNVMAKLGVNSDAGLLDAADILLYMHGTQSESALPTAV